jgi:hypothetical protein
VLLLKVGLAAVSSAPHSLLLCIPRGKELYYLLGVATFGKPATRAKSFLAFLYILLYMGISKGPRLPHCSVVSNVKYLEN